MLRLLTKASLIRYHLPIRMHQTHWRHKAYMDRIASKQDKQGLLLNQASPQASRRALPTY